MGFHLPKLAGIFIIIAAVGLSACDGSSTTATRAADVISVSNPWIRATAPGQKVSGAFLTLNNASATPVTLVGAEFSDAASVEIHETSMNGKMMRMQRVEQLEIPANGSVALKPGSYHIMLMGLGKSLQAGTTESLVLIFADQSQTTIAAPVAVSAP